MRNHKGESLLFQEDLPQEKHVFVGHVFVRGDTRMRIHEMLNQRFRCMFGQKEYILLNDGFRVMDVRFGRSVLGRQMDRSNNEFKHTTFRKRSTFSVNDSTIFIPMVMVLVLEYITNGLVRQ